MTEPMADRLERALAKLSYFDGDRASGQGIGRYLLSLMIGLLGGMIPKLMNPEFTGNFTDAGGDAGANKTAARQSRALHLLLFLLILTSSLSSPALGEGLTPVFIATLVLYVWFSCLIKCRAVYIIGVLAMLVVAMLVYRVRVANAQGASPYHTDLMRRLELYLYSGAMAATVGAVVLSAPGTGLDKLTGLFHFVWGKDIFGNRGVSQVATAFGESPLTTAPTSVTTFGYDYP